MRTIHSDSELAVIDDFLPDEQAREFWHYFEDADFTSAHTPVVKGVWRVDDGQPLLGPQLIWPSRPPEELLPPGVRMPEMAFNQFLCPTGKPVDGVLSAIKTQASAHTDIVGTELKDWVGILAQLQVYPMGTGLSWHVDLDVYTGAFVYYAHREWNAQWGGELLVADRAVRDATGGIRKRKHFFANDDVSDVLMSGGVGRWVAPRPNRLVILAGKDLHAIAKVDPAAGDHVRASIAGFFISPTGVANLVADAMRGARARGQ